MKKGFTTGSCAAAAAKAAAYMLLSGRKKETIQIETPAGIMFDAQIVDICINEEQVSCAVIKDGGDDPDVTSGAHIVATVKYGLHNNAKHYRINISGGEGVGRVTRPGLDQPVGEAAINSIPRQMITKEVLEVINLFDYPGTIDIKISVPEGVDLAGKTFNPRLGIEGGISILGTTGIVEPMSTKALLDTIRVELNQKRALGYKNIVLAPGNYGLDFMRSTYDYDLDSAVKCSNYIGLSIDMAKELGFENVLLVGHIGKLVKVAGGIMNTHSKEADCRMEILAAAALCAGADTDTLTKILQCVNTTEVFDILISRGLSELVGKSITDKVKFYVNHRAGGDMNIECMIYSNEHGMIGCTDGAVALLDEIKGKKLLDT